jgi:hypothetical protein
MPQNPWEIDWSKTGQSAQSGAQPWEMDWSESGQQKLASAENISVGNARLPNVGHAEYLTSGKGTKTLDQTRDENIAKRESESGIGGWGRRLWGDIQKVNKLYSTDTLSDRFGALLDIPNTLLMPVTNLIRRTFDPTNALGGDVNNYGENRPFKTDPNAGQYVEGLVTSAFMPQTPRPVTEPPAEAVVVSKPGPITRIQKYRANLKEAQNTLQTAPEQRLSLNAEITNQRAAAKSALLNEQALAQQEFNGQAAAQIQPLTAERTHILNAKTSLSADLASSRTGIREGLQSQLSALNQETAAAKQSAASELNLRAEMFTNEIGKEMNKIELAQGTQQARAAGWKRYTDRVNQIYDGIRDNTFSRNISTIETGHRPTGLLDEIGRPIMEPITKQVAGPVDLSSVKTALNPFYDRFKNELAIARQNQSPGANAVIQIMEGPDVVPGDVAIDNLKSLNRLGYGKADAVIRESGEAIARKACAVYREALKQSIGKMEGGKEALASLEEARALLSKRDQLYRTGELISGKPIARAAAEQIEKSGNVTALIKDPVKFHAFWRQIEGTPVEAGTTRQIAVRVLGNGYKDFAARWPQLNPTIKQMIFTPEQIENGNRLASEGPEILRNLAEKAAAKNAEIIQGTMQQLTDIGTQRQQLSGITQNVRELNTKIGDERRALQLSKQAKSFELKQKASNLKADIDAYQLERRSRLGKDIREARETIEKADRIKKAALIGAGILGLGGLGWKAHKVAALLGW